VAKRSTFERGDVPETIDTAVGGASLIREQTVLRECSSMYGAPGPVGVAYYDFGTAPAPAAFVVYDLPPGTGEGVHTHRIGEPPPGPFDEYYYVIAGEGEMTVDGKSVPLRAGDMLRIPPGIAHGLFNTGPEQSLRVFLCFISKAPAV
jgi:oxalate decarboxylase/phosphoglucose isomerase-like protein (cupin superfamily)